MHIRLTTVFLLIILSLCPVLVRAQSPTFTSFDTTGIAPTVFGDIALGDLNRDGWLDVVVSGTLTDGSGNSNLSVYLNRTKSTDFKRGYQRSFSETPGIYYTSLDLGDLDNDGDIDILLAGSTPLDGKKVVFLYRNDGATFTRTEVYRDQTGNNKAAYLEAVRTPAAALGDYNGDQRLDLLVAGNGVLLLFRNEGSFSFSRVDTYLPPVEYGSIEWGDYDKDGDLDILAANRTEEGTPRIHLLQNDGSGVFADVTSIEDLKGLSDGSVSWADLNEDGHLDISVLGVSRIFPSGVIKDAVNDLFLNSDGTFLPLWNPFTSRIYPRYAQWVELSGDNRLDALIGGSLRVTSSNSGTTSTPIPGSVYVNSSGILEKGAELPFINNGAIDAGDLDRDGDNDIIVGGRTDNSANDPILNVLRNDGTGKNRKPVAPQGLFAHWKGNALILEWSPGADVETQQAALTYNLRVGTRPLLDDVVSASSLTDGTRLIVKDGNAGHQLRWEIRGLDLKKTYYWSVQTVDVGKQGSAFADEQVVKPPQTGTGGKRPPILLKNAPNPFNPETTIEYELPEGGQVQMIIYNILGAEVVRLFDGPQSDGVHTVRWDGRDALGMPVPSGVYLCHLSTPTQVVTHKMLLLK